MAKKFATLRAPIDADPARRARVDEKVRALETMLALSDVRAVSGMTQTEVAGGMGTSQENVSRIEREEDPRISTLDRYITALGGQLEMIAVFDDQRIDLRPTAHERTSLPSRLR